jgi:hypothetical protein
MDELQQTPAPEPAPVAEVVLPREPDAPTTPAPTAADDWTRGLDYAGMIEAHGITGMTVDELRGIYPDAAHVVQQYMGTDFAESDGGLGNDPHMLRALGRAGKDLRDLEASFKDASLKLPPGSSVRPPTLSGQALEREIQHVLNDYLDTPARQRLESSGLLATQEGRGFVTRLATARYQYRSSLSAMQAIQPQVQARTEAARERREFDARSPGVKALSESAFQSTLSGLHHQLGVARWANSVSEMKRLETEIMRLYELRG